MKVTLEYNLPEEKSELTSALSAGDLKSMLWCYSQWLRTQVKYSQDDKLLPGLETAKEEFYRLLAAHDIDLED